MRRAALDSPASLAEAVRGVDVVVHLAAMMDFYPQDVRLQHPTLMHGLLQEVADNGPTITAGGQKVAALYQTNVEGTRNLLTAFADARQGRGGTFIYISSTESAALTLYFI